MSQLPKALIHDALALVSEQLAGQGVQGEICLFGGTAMMLAFDARETTRDVDGVFRPPETIRAAALHAAETLALPADWPNDGVKGWLSECGDTTAEGLPAFSHLRLIRPTDRYLLAMKCLAARVPGYDTGGDRADISFLLRRLGIQSAEAALEIVGAYYPRERIGVKTQYLVEEILAEINASGEKPS